MTHPESTVNQMIGSKPFYVRHHTKRDGRDLFLYGYAPHEGAALAEDDSLIAKGGELRYHPFRQEWNIYAAHRQNRTFKPSAADDPLAPSKLDGPKTEIPFTDFELAVFENKFTSLHTEAPSPATIPNVRSGTAGGRCEVVVYTPEATGSLHTVGQDKRRLLIAAWLHRYEALFDLGCKFVLPFESRGDEVGVTLHHPHGQIYGFPYIPGVQHKMATTFDAGYSLSADIAAFKDTYEIANAGGMSAFCPAYARFPLEVWIAPETRKSGLWRLSETELDGFAHLLGDITRRYDQYFGRATAYMLSLHSAPTGFDGTFHFSAQFYPLLRAPGRVKFLASVEQSTGTFTVDVMPEMAADILRGQ